MFLRLNRNRFFHNRVALIYDAATAVGQETVNNFVHRGSHIVLASRNKQILTELEGQFQNHRIGLIGVPVNFESKDSVQHLVALTLKHFARIDYFIFINPHMEISNEIPPDISSMKMLMENDFHCLNEILNKVTPLMVERRTGHIVILSPFLDYHLLGNYSGLSSGNNKIMNYLDSLRQEIHRSGVKLSLINPVSLDNNFTVEGARLPWYVRPISPIKIASQIAGAVYRNNSRHYIPSMSLKLFILMNRFFQKNGENITAPADESGQPKK
jgi:short-subunit dehydrogenase